MARIMFVWELGLGLGHLAPYLDLVKALRKQSHQVIFIARDVASAESVFGREGVVILQAPITLRKVPNPYKVQYNYSQLIHNIGFADPRELLARVKAWLHLFQYVRPELALFDHSPTALVAARALKCKKIISGSGFLIPPPGYPLPKMRYWDKYDEAELKRSDDGVAAVINKVLEVMKLPQLTHMENLFKTDEQFLLGFHELDHYPMRKDGNYFGTFSIPGYGEEPVWPKAGKKKVFAYLHNFKTMPVLFQVLNKLGIRSLIYAPDLPQEVRKKHTTQNLKFVDKPLNMEKVAAECDVTITNGTYGTTCALLLGGKPVLMFPQNLERIMVARRVIGIGAGMVAPINKPKLFGPRLRTLLNDKRYTQAAQAFAKRHAGLNQEWQTTKMVQTINGLLPAPKEPETPVAADK